MKKTDSVTDEEFECTSDESCWCHELPHVVPFSEDECIGPKRLQTLVKEKKNDTQSSL